MLFHYVFRARRALGNIRKSQKIQKTVYNGKSTTKMSGTLNPRKILCILGVHAIGYIIFVFSKFQKFY